MARFDVYPNRDGPGYLLDCQADALSDLSTRFVVPLLPPHEAPRPISGLNPRFRLESEDVFMMTHFAASVSASYLGEAVGSLDHEYGAILNAFDKLVTGY
jgi:toxin CcdB